MPSKRKSEKPLVTKVATEFSIEVREYAAPLQFLAIYQIVATTLRAAMLGAVERFKIDYPKKNIADHSFQRTRNSTPYAASTTEQVFECLNCGHVGPLSKLPAKCERCGNGAGIIRPPDNPPEAAKKSG